MAQKHTHKHDRQPGEQPRFDPLRGHDFHRAVDYEAGARVQGARATEEPRQQMITSRQAPAAGTAALAERVLSAPGHGRNYFFPATASGQPLALAGFALTLGLLSLGNAGWINLNALGIVVPAALAYGGLALILAGLWDFRYDDLFGAMWAVSFGCFFITLALLIQFVGPQVVAAAGASAYADAFGAYLLLWAIFSAYMTVGAYFIAKTAFLTFLLLAIVFLILGIANLLAPGGASDGLRQLGGYVGLVDAAVAWYLSAALMLNTTSGRQLLPI